MKNVLRVVYGIVATHLLNKFQRFLKGIEEKKTLKNLIETKDLVIQKADKGSTIVILNKNDNISRPKWILDDTSKFKKVPCWGRTSLKSYYSYGRAYYWFTDKF